MYERFTDRARKVMQLGKQEAQRFNHKYIGTEHIFLGLVKEGSDVAANVLKNLDIDLGRIRLEVEMLVQSGPDCVTTGKLPQTPRAKKVIRHRGISSGNAHRPGSVKISRTPNAMLPFAGSVCSAKCKRGERVSNSNP
jgi:ATP-dependent Clp protease ATP-binding subunit ClpA